MNLHYPQGQKARHLLVNIINCCRRMTGQECIYASGQYGSPEVYVWDSRPGSDLQELDDLLLDWSRFR
jgi:hypothetical protein